MPNPLRPTLALLALTAPLLAQCPPGAPMPQDIGLETTMAASGPAHARLQTAIAALKNGDPSAARKHLFAALEFHPSSADLLLEVVLACGDDPDLLTLWSERYLRAAANDKGRVKLGTPTRKRLSAVAGAADLIKATQPLAGKRAAAISELSRYIQRQKPKGKQNAPRALLVRWASSLLLEVGEGAPQALASVAPAVAQMQQSFDPDYDVIYRALAEVMRRPLPNPERGAGDAPTTGVSSDVDKINDQRIRAARILAGLRRQVAFKDLQGERPAGPGKYADEAQSLLDTERKSDVQEGKIWTIAELEAMSPEDAERFTQQHRDWHHPGLALSTNSRYRIETICGHHTLLGTAKTIELHHARLVSHYGKDPFEQRQGIARIVPESSDLETEGAPYWWAAGFQSGDRTTVRFAWGNIPGLGRTLTHELTHRFDGVLRPFLPTWYVEGHADWTGAHYAKMADAKFVENFLKRGTAAHTFYKGYERKRKFEKLLAGEVDDYRDNYFAGYSLYAFLSSYPPDAPRYRGALGKFENNARAGRRDPVGYFTSTFCDGKDGRPEDFDGLYEDWRKFLRDCYDWGDARKRNQDNAWIRRYGGLGRGDGASLVMDEPTWSWARKRAEPFYGQDHAAAATLLLDEVGDVEGTISAGTWSLTADGWRPEVARALAKALRASREQDAAAAFAPIAHRHFADIANAAAGRLLAALPKTKALMAALAARVDDLAAAAKPQAAAATARDHADLAHWFGSAVLPQAKGIATAGLPRHLGGTGITESGLTDYEDRRRKGLWYVTPEGDLHVGREQPREATGVLDRRAQQRDAFAHSVGWQAPGHYVLRGRVHFTTSFASGAIVFGHTRRDRDLRLAFSSGDFAYATGRSEVNERKGSVRFRIIGLWERDRHMPGSMPVNSVEIPEEQNWFEYALYVRGPRVLVEINGDPLLRYAVHDGTPIEGHVGFAMNNGAIRAQQPTVQRLDTVGGTDIAGLDIAQQPTVELDDLMLLPTRGIPTNPNGTLVLWLPKADPDAGSSLGRINRALRQVSKLLQTEHEHPQQWLLAVPRGIDKAERKEAIAMIKELRDAELPVIEHDVDEPFGGRHPWVLFVDAQGVLRSAASSRDAKLHTRVARWARRFRRR